MQKQKNSTTSSHTQHKNQLIKLYLDSKVIITKLTSGFRIKIIAKQQQGGLKIYQSIFTNDNLIQSAKSIFQDTQTTFAYIAQHIKNDKLVFLKHDHSLQVNYYLKVGSIEKKKQIVFPIERVQKGLQELLLKQEYQSKLKNLQESFFKSNQKIFQLQDQIKKLKQINDLNQQHNSNFRMTIENQQSSISQLKNQLSKMQSLIFQLTSENQALKKQMQLLIMEKKAYKSQLQLQNKVLKDKNISLSDPSYSQTQHLVSAPPITKFPYSQDGMKLKRIGNSQLDQTSKKFKITFLGGTKSGKTAIIQRFVHGKYDGGQFKPTIGIDFLSIAACLNDQKFRLQIWDTAGQQRFKSLVPSYLKDSAAVVFVFDLADHKSFQQIAENWLPMALDNALQNQNKYLVGTKADQSIQFLNHQIYHEFAEKNKLIYFEISSKQNQGIETLFYNISKNLLNR